MIEKYRPDIITAQILSHIRRINEKLDTATIHSDSRS